MNFSSLSKGNGAVSTFGDNGRLFSGELQKSMQKRRKVTIAKPRVLTFDMFVPCKLVLGSRYPVSMWDVSPLVREYPAQILFPFSASPLNLNIRNVLSSANYGQYRTSLQEYSQEIYANRSTEDITEVYSRIIYISPMSLLSPFQFSGAPPANILTRFPSPHAPSPCQYSNVIILAGRCYTSKHFQ